ncbi:hypothetical protein EKO27_g590 [Xylaria grammica]|uniref:Ubiquitin-like protease family profile domain-containing protein n=1 Tax=Xylaria grammica TaxID=363999 RepID=A0A439DJE4_9PEZI|nr:hypothetical protein EKO27_g590 [Xylaria grammica]
MAFVPQPRSRVIHSWTTPGHYLNCSPCRDYRRVQARNAEATANRAGRLCAIGVGQPFGQPFSSRILAISPRLNRLSTAERLQRGIGLLPQGRRVTIQVPSLGRPVRPNQPTGLRGTLRQDYCQKRPSTCTDNPEPAQYLVPCDVPPRIPTVPKDTPRDVARNHSFVTPGQFPEDIDVPNQQSSSHAATDFWAANSELIRQAALERAQASAAAESSSTPAVTENYFSMPGTWPAWADDPSGVPPPVRSPVAPRPHIEPDNPLNPPGPNRNGFFSIVENLSALFRGAFQAVRWRAVEPQPAQDTAETTNATTTDATSTAPQAAGNDGSRTPKRSRSDTGPTNPDSRQFKSRNRQLPDRSVSLGPGRRTGSMHNRYANNNGPASYRVANGNQNDPGFSNAGRIFSFDAVYASDSEDDEDVYPGSPMDIDSPEPIVLNKTETILAQQSINTIHTQSSHRSDEHKPIASNKTEAIAQQSTHPINVESKAKFNSATAAARRAVNLFPKDLAVTKATVTPFPKGNTSHETLPSEIPPTIAPAVGKLRHKIRVASTSADISMLRKTEKARYINILDFFPNDVDHSLPGLEDERLSPDAVKVEHLKRELMERLRREEIESQNAALAHLGVRRPKSALIREPSEEWANRALDAPNSGKFNPQAVHPDAVELRPRDFAKLVPEMAWLNDDCIQSTLCCLAAYINKKASVKPKVDPPKCVAVTSLYWKTFCQDNNKLYPRPFSRKWNMTQTNFLDIDTVLIPVNLDAHWTLIVIRPSRRTVSYIDSFHRRNEAQIRHAYRWVELFLGDKFVADDWNTQEFGTPKQTNAWDCGVFVITNAMCLALGLSPMCYDEGKMPVQRRRIAAMLLNGGFSGEFDLGDL